MRKTILIVTFLMVAGLLSLGRAEAGDNFTFYSSPHRAGPWDGPACDADAVTRHIIGRFNRVEKEYWGRGLRMAAVAGAHEDETRQWDPPLIAARYCNATAYFSDGSRRELVYWVRSEQGFAGVGWGLQYCVIGLDQQMAYAPACRMLRPL